MFPREIQQAAQQHAIAEFPKESVGLVLQDGDRFSYAALQNIAADPTRHFELRGADLLDYEPWARALVHSHPMGHAVPSSADMRQQQAMAVPGGIIATDGQRFTPITWFGAGAPKGPLIGRGFIHGHQDCLSLIIDWHAERGIILPDHPRDWEWWVAGVDGAGQRQKAADHYRDLYQADGYVMVEEARAGCVGFAALGADDKGRPNLIPNHGFLYLGDGTILHHLAGPVPLDLGRLSARHPIGLWLRHFNGPITWVRHKDLP